MVLVFRIPILNNAKLIGALWTGHGLSSLACKDYFAEALFVVGELGWNDYAVMLLTGKSVDEAGSHVTEIVGNICAATEVG